MQLHAFLSSALVTCPLYLREKRPRYPSDKRLGAGGSGPIWTGWRREKNPYLCRKSSPGRPAQPV